MDPQQLQIVLSQLAHAYGMPPPPPLTPDQIASGSSLMSQLLATLGLAGNSGDPSDMAAAQAQYAQRGQKTGEAMTKFPANEEESSKQLEQLMGTAGQIPQQLMQAVGGLFGGFSQAINQAAQQGSQIGSQLASTVGKAGQGAGLAAEVPADALGDALSELGIGRPEVGDAALDDASPSLAGPPRCFIMGHDVDSYGRPPSHLGVRLPGERRARQAPPRATAHSLRQQRHRLLAAAA